MRIFKPGNLYYNFALIDTNDWFFQPNPKKLLKIFSIFFYMGWSHSGTVQNFNLLNNEIKPLNKFISVNIGNKILDNRSFKYFFRSYHEPFKEDRFLDNAIALENILVNDTKERSNLLYKFVDRGCFLLQQVLPLKNGPEKYAKSLRNSKRTI